MKLWFTTSQTRLTAEFDACYALMQATFPADELVDRAEYTYLLAAPHLINHPHWFAMLARWTNDPSPRLAGMIAGSYMALNASQGVGMIEYLAVAPNHQQGGHGKALLDAFEELMRQFAQERGETLCWIVGEVEDELLPFKFHLGYGLPESLCYVQPPIEFDAVGQPCYAPVLKHLVMKPMNDQPMEIDPSMLRAVIQTIYVWRYVPLLGDERVRALAAAFIEQDVYRRVSESVGETPIVLHQKQPHP